MALDPNGELIAAIVDGDLTKAKHSLANGADVNYSTEYGITPLHCAANGGHADIAAYLISIGAEIDARDRRGSTPLLNAVLSHHHDVGELLASYGADVNAEPGPSSNTPMFYASQIPGMSEALQRGLRSPRTLKRPPASPAKKAEPAWKHTDALIAASAQGNLGAVRDLLAQGVDPNAIGDYDYLISVTALFAATVFGKEEAAALLLQHGADPNWRHGPKSILQRAVWERQRGIVRLLLTHGADPNLQTEAGKTPLMEAASGNDKEILGLLEAAGAKKPGNAIASICPCGESITAVPGGPFTCPACRAQYPMWQPPGFYIRQWVEQGTYGRDDDSRRYAAKLLARPEPIQAAAIHLSGILWEWEAAYRGGSTRVMRACEERLPDARERLMQAGGNALWYEACMAMPPHLRHVASKDFGTNGQYHGAFNPD